MGLSKCWNMSLNVYVILQKFHITISLLSWVFVPIYKHNDVMVFCFQKSSSGQDLIERVFTYLDIMERDYFGLRFVDGSSHNQGQQWLDPKKEIKKQSRGAKGNPTIYHSTRQHVQNIHSLFIQYIFVIRV